ncbi:Carboxypeptidase regulatory-like domain-containing protein [Sulfidibacter corallicola]|uniref:Carboxypeptidase regulatory-like domain-containing protein n=1 Tax=Sulfidibacter corallicola TaxID=2818388 RepID=A0A8A4TU34_SULCO|nr:carboxypeptidase-like regulatory domain-containing protein [Sulfidibacter corallicola]QTD52628.1 carboxypeptidase regulatory-like domain-containing protein [Sulfidibacter corallicola]
MLKWLAIAFAGLMPCFGATITGLVQTEEGRPLSGAKIVIFHEMAHILVQRGISDRNGQYQFNLEPGQYQLFVLKKGYLPVRTKALLRYNRETIALRHDLPLELDLSENEQTRHKLKRMIRRANRDPYRELDGLALVKTGSPLGPIPRSSIVDDSLTAKVTTGARQGLNGDEQRATVMLVTQVTDAVSVNSSLRNDRRADGLPESFQIMAGVDYAGQDFSIGLEAETIRDEMEDLPGRTERLHLEGRFGDQVVANTRVSLIDTHAFTDRHRELRLEQELDYDLLGQVISHQVRFGDWQRNQNPLARQASFDTIWKYRDNAMLGLASEVDYLTVENGDFTSAKLWVTGDHQREDQRFAVQTKLGVHEEEQHSGVVQQHFASARFGVVGIELEFADDFDYRPYASHDVFGAYLQTPSSAYVNEGFYKNENRSTEVRVGMDHGTWESKVTWSQQDGNVEQVQPIDNPLFKSNAQFRTRDVAYQLTSARYGSLLEIRYSKNEGDTTRFDYTELVFGQTLSPFRDRALLVLIEIQASNQPTLPAWWILERLPWDVLERGAWLEGQVSFQF